MAKAKANKPFAYHWGSGIVAEEAQVEGEYHIPTLQLLRYTEGASATEVIAAPSSARRC